jgi:hypothetical protein
MEVLQAHCAMSFPMLGSLNITSRYELSHSTRTPASCFFCMSISMVFVSYTQNRTRTNTSPNATQAVVVGRNGGCAYGVQKAGAQWGECGRARVSLGACAVWRLQLSLCGAPPLTGLYRGLRDRVRDQVWSSLLPHRGVAACKAPLISEWVV